VERLVILYFKPLFPSVQFAYAKCHRNDNSSSTVFIGSLQLLLQVFRLRLLGDYHHSTRIAFVEFVMVSQHTFVFFIFVQKLHTVCIVNIFLVLLVAENFQILKC
jgi:hypothetical protein